MGEPVVAAVGFASSQELLNPDWSDLESQFRLWTRSAQAQAVKIARVLAGLPADDDLVSTAETTLAEAITPAWTSFETALNGIAEAMLYNPDPNAAEATFNPDTVVPTGAVRNALTIAGGTPPPDSVLDIASPIPLPEGPSAAMMSVDVPLGQIGTGDAITGMLNDSGNVEVATYEWVHNYSGPSPFEPHEDLDGVSFTSFTDDVLANDSGFPDTAFYLPGDHENCGCDYSVTWTPAALAAGEEPEDDDGDGSDEDAPEPDDDSE
jgi:hypothetical protein